MENQHRKISGYRELSQAEIDLMNEIKAFGPKLQALVEKIEAHVTEQLISSEGIYSGNTPDTAEINRLAAADPLDWTMTGKQHLQQGLMALTRAIAQPTFF